MEHLTAKGSNTRIMENFDTMASGKMETATVAENYTMAEN